LYQEEIIYGVRVAQIIFETSVWGVGGTSSQHVTHIPIPIPHPTLLPTTLATMYLQFDAAIMRVVNNVEKAVRQRGIVFDAT
jgi:hypothetical protein